MANNNHIPVVDFAPFLEAQEKGDDGGCAVVAKEVIDAFKNVGFVYLKNYSTLTQLSKGIFELSKTFFHQPEEVKLEVKIGDVPEDVQGYVPLGAEMLSNTDVDNDGNIKEVDSTQHKGDYKETFQVYSETAFKYKNRWPSNIPHFKEKIDKFFEACDEANVNIMRCIAIGLGLDKHYFDNNCTASALRLLHYPPMLKKDNSARAGAHTDYGSITLLFQDDIGGLQVMNKEGVFIDAPPIPDTIIINVADMLQRWSNDKLKSTMHRVVAPTKKNEGDNSEYNAERFSIVFFCTPDLDLTIECLPGCEGEMGPKYPPVQSGVYLLSRITGHY